MPMELPVSFTPEILVPISSPALVQLFHEAVITTFCDPWFLTFPSFPKGAKGRSVHGK